MRHGARSGKSDRQYQQARHLTNGVKVALTNSGNGFAKSLNEGIRIGERRKEAEGAGE
jgi:hypothetical protein